MRSDDLSESRPFKPYEIPAAGALGLLAAGARGLEAWRTARDGSLAFLPTIEPRERSKGRRRVLLIGWDAADHRMISPLVDAGLMPTMERLICGGAIGNLRTVIPPMSPLVWTSIATGMTADRHGILDFREPTPEGRIRPIQSTSRQVKALWNMAHQKQLRSCVVGWWPSHPAEPIDGVMVSNDFQRGAGPAGDPWPIAAGSVHPPAIAAELATLRVHPQELTAAHLLPFVPLAARIDQTRDTGLSTIARSVAEAASVHAVATWLMERVEWDLMAVYLDAIDHFGHTFMRFHPPRRPHVPEDLFELYQGVMTAAYRFHDMMLERLLELAGPECTVVLVSDHGFHPDHLRRAPHVPAGPVVEHREQGVICIAGPGIMRDELIFGASVLDVTPTVLALLDLPLGRDMKGKPLLQAFEEAPTLRYVESWETRPGGAGLHTSAQAGDPWAEREALKGLAALGYVERPELPEQDVELHWRESRLTLARCLMSQRRHAEALPILEEVVASAPDEIRYALSRTECALRLERFEDCQRHIESLREALRVKGEATGPRAKEVPRGLVTANAMLDVLEGELRLALGQADVALQLFRAAGGAEGIGVDALLGVGNVHLRRSEWSEAILSFDRALGLDADSSPAHLGRAIALLGLGAPAPSAAAALESVGLDYLNPLGHFHLAEALAALGDFVGAAERLEVCLSQAPGFLPARRRLVALYATKLRRIEAAGSHRRWLNDVPDQT